MSFDITYFEQIGGSIAMRAANKAFAEECELGFVDDMADGTNPENQALCIVLDGEVKSIITYADKSIYKYTWITSSWTDGDYRNLGMHTALFDELCRRSKEKGMRSIDSLVHIDNVQMNKLANKQGRKLKMFNYVKEL